MQEQYHTSNLMKTKYPYINKPSPTYESYISDISSSEDFQYPQHKNTSKDPWKVENDTYNRSFQAQKERFERNHIAPHTKITDPWQSKKRDVLDFDNRSTKQQNISAKDRRKGIVCLIYSINQKILIEDVGNWLLLDRTVLSSSNADNSSRWKKGCFYFTFKFII